MQVNSVGIDTHSSFDLKKTVNGLYDELATTLLQGIVNNSISSELSQDISSTILQRLDTVQSKEELLEFLQQLATKWSVYNPFYIKMKYEEEQEKDQEKIKDVQDKLQQFMKGTYGSRNTIT